MHKELISGELNCIALGLVGQRRIYLELSSALLDTGEKHRIHRHVPVITYANLTQ